MCTKPRSSFAAVLSTPVFSVIGRRPTAIKTFSAVTFRIAGLALENDGRALRTFFTLSTLASVSMRMPRFLKAFISSAEISSSSSGTARGNISRMVTSAPKVLENRSELNAHRSGANDHQRFRNRRQFQNFSIGENRLAVDLNARQRARIRARREHRIRRLDLGFLAVFLHRDAARPGDASPAGDRFHFAFAEEKFDAFGVLIDDFLFARQDRRPIHFHIFHVEAEFRGVLEGVVNFRVMQQHFGGDAADVQAGAADVGIFLNDRGFQSVLPGANRGYIAARSAADNH